LRARADVRRVAVYAGKSHLKRAGYGAVGGGAAEIAARRAFIN
jgi:hypothetical protein